MRQASRKLGAPQNINTGDDTHTLIAQITDQEPLGNHTTLLLEAMDIEITASVEAKHNFGNVPDVRLGIDPQQFHYFDA